MASIRDRISSASGSNDLQEHATLLAEHMRDECSEYADGEFCVRLFGDWFKQLNKSTQGNWPKKKWKEIHSFYEDDGILIVVPGSWEKIRIDHHLARAIHVKAMTFRMRHPFEEATQRYVLWRVLVNMLRQNQATLSVRRGEATFKLSAVYVAELRAIASLF